MKLCISWGHTESCISRKSSLKVSLIHAVDISTSIHSDHDVVVVRRLRVAHYGKFEVFPFIELSPVGFNMINHFKHIYPWWWIWLSDSIFINVGVIIILGDCCEVNPLGGSFLALANLVELFYFVTFLALGILGWTPLSWLVFMFSTSHALFLHPWGFSRMMSRIRRSLLSRFILCLLFSILCILLVLTVLVLSMVIQNKVHRSCGIQLT